MESDSTTHQHWPQEPQQEEELPGDFARRIATKIIVTNERERDPDTALQKVATFVIRNLHRPGRLKYFFDAVEILLDDEETRRYAAVAWASLVLDRENNPRYDRFLSDALDAILESHINMERPPYEMEYRRKKFSAWAHHLGDVFIAMMEINSELYEVIGHIYSEVIRKEMAIEAAERDNRGGGRRVTLNRNRNKREGKKLFDDVVDYIHARGEFRSESLNQQNPNEFMVILADRMRGTRRYVIQDIMNRQALEKKKEAEKELSERLASAEEIILARDTFKKAVNLFWTEKRYNYKYLSVEKVRVTIQVLAVVVGITHFLIGYLGMFGMYWWEGLIVAVGMYLFARFLGSRRAFSRYFPEDVSKELEVVVGGLTPTFRRMSKDQLDAFLIRQVKDPDNINVLPILPEFVKYVFAVMPDRNSMVISMEELSEIMEAMELDIARTLRSTQQRGGF